MFKPRSKENFLQMPYEYGHDTTKRCILITQLKVIQNRVPVSVTLYFNVSYMYIVIEDKLFDQLLSHRHTVISTETALFPGLLSSSSC